MSQPDSKCSAHKGGTPAVSVVVPILNAAALLPALLEQLAAQKPVAPGEIILVDSNSSDNPHAVVANYPHLNIQIIPVKQFTHGGARNLGAQAASGAIIVLMSQDALPRDEQWLAALIAAFDEPEVAAAFSRQEPYPDAPPTEQFFLNYHFPPDTPRRWCAASDCSQPAFGRTVFFSNVSAAVRRDCLLQHPFDETLIMSEDQQLARDLLKAGYTLTYQPNSVALHSHRYSLFTAFRRYFDSVYSLTTIFKNHDMAASASLGLTYLRQEASFILRRYPWYLPYYILYTIAKTAGTIAGHYAERMPRALARFCSLHRYHWDR